MAKIAIYGGSFNPPTYAHRIVGEIVYAESDVDYIWYMPCYKHKFNKSSLSPEHRLEMTKIMVDYMNVNKEGSVFQVCNAEYILESSGSTFELMEFLTSKFNHDFSIVVGTDCANDIHKWHNGKALIESYPFIIVGRNGYGGVPEWAQEKPHAIVSANLNCSSTQVRDGIENNDPRVYTKLDLGIKHYIIKNNLYLRKSDHEN